MKRSDPREIITPDVYSVAPGLVGIRLAHPGRRLIAIGIDLLFVSLIARTSLAVLIGLVVSLLLWRSVAVGTSPSLTRRAARLALRFCIALFTFILVLKLWGAVKPGSDSPPERPGQIAGMSDGMPAPPAAAPAPGALAPAPPGRDRPDDTSVRDSMRDSTAAGAQNPAANEAAPGEGVVLAEMARENARLQQQNAALQDRIDDQDGPVHAFVAEIIDELGLGLGWFGFYFTVLTVLGRGQTPGKRILGIRVIRLDAMPIGWWIAFERFGGYAASVFSGMLGFAQVLWDRNRQALHDKATGTVVIRVINGEPARLPVNGFAGLTSTAKPSGEQSAGSL